MDSIRLLNETLIKQAEKNTELTIQMYNRNHISKDEVVDMIVEKLDILEEQVLHNTLFIDCVLYNEMKCLRKILDIVDSISNDISKRYNDIVLIANLMFSKDIELGTI